MRVLVCGSREWDDWQVVHSVLNGFYADAACEWLTVDATPFVVIEGGARGADSIAHDWVYHCPLHGEPVLLATFDPVTYHDKPSGMPVASLRFPADWSKGKAAGYIRNRRMLEEGKPDFVLAFGHGKGTDMMVNLAVTAGVPTYRIVKENTR